MITLRPYQHEAIETVRAAYRAGVRAPLLVAPTGSGKTVMFAYIAQGAVKKGNRIWALAHRAELVDQIGETLDAFDVPHGFVASGYPKKPSAPVQVCSVQSLINRMPEHHKPDLIIIDEAHHATKANTIGRIIAANPQASLLGVTATPHRLSGEGLGDVFTDMILGPTVESLIQIGSLSPVRVFSPPTMDTSGLHIRAGDYVPSELAALADKPKITGDVIEHYKRLANGKRAVAFCVSVDHANHVAESFIAAGFNAVRLDGNMDRQARRDAVRKFRDGAIHVLTSCDLVSEGFDCPGIDVGISLRPTASLGLWLQQCGRCLRVFPGKSEALILDHAGNALRHGLPTEHREWSLEGSGGKGKRLGVVVASVRVCPSCFASSKTGTTECSNCGKPFPAKARAIEEADGELQEVKARAKSGATPERKEQGRAGSIDALVELAKIRGYKSPERWAQYVFDGRQKRMRA